MTPAAAREREIALQVFSKTEVLTLEALADAIVPGAQKAGHMPLSGSPFGAGRGRLSPDD